MERIERNLAAVNADIAAAAGKAGRRLEDIRLVVVTKNQPAEVVSAALAAGATDIGENKAQELLLKQARIEVPVRWHFIGRLQKNKVKQVVGAVDLIQSVDGLELAREIDKRAAGVGLVQAVLIQVNVAEETTKQGLGLSDLEKAIAKIDKLKHIKIEGLMTIAPLSRDGESARPVFAKLKQVYDTLTGSWALRWLSMGMTDDFVVAIEEGSNMVRVGRAVFGPGRQ